MVANLNARVVPIAPCLLRNRGRIKLRLVWILCSCIVQKLCHIISIFYQHCIVHWEGQFNHIAHRQRVFLPALCAIKIFKIHIEQMKKTILSIMILFTVLLSAVLVYGNRSKSKPAREYIECKPAPVNTNQHQANTLSTSFTFSLLVL